MAADAGHESCAALIRSWPSLRNQIAVKLSVNTLKRQGLYDAIRETPNNDLTKGEFAFKVLEMMMSCKMEPLVEDLIKCVGTKIGLA